MAQETNGSKNTSMGMMDFDLYYFIRCLKKSIAVIVFSAVIACVGAYVVSDYFASNSYSAKVHFAIMNRGGYSDSGLNTAVTRNLSVLNSESLRLQMMKNSEDLKGNVQARRVADSNLIVLTANSDTAYNAIRLLIVALDSYPSLAEYFGYGYILKRLDQISVKSISVNRTQPQRTALLALLGTLAAGIALTALYCMYSPYIYNTGRAGKSLDINLLGSIQFIRKKKKQKAVLITDERTDISYYEEIDKLATSVKKQLDKENCKVLTVNSIYANEGKTTISSNLALNLAKRGKKVLLIDGDIRRGALAKTFDYKVPEGRSFSDLLLGRASFQDVVVRDSQMDSLFYIFQGSPVSSPDLLFQRQEFTDLLAYLKEQVDYVIIDMPPIGIVRDAEIVASVADAAFMVIRQDQVRVEEVNDAVDVLDETGVTVIGGILNMVHGEKNSIIGYGHYGRYYYGYGYDTKKR